MFVGLLIITLSGVIFKEFDPLSRKVTKTIELLNEIVSRKHKKEKYEVHYFDEKLQAMKVIPHTKIKKMENNFIVVEEKNGELFIPVHRVRKIKENNKVIWKK